MTAKNNDAAVAVMIKVTECVKYTWVRLIPNITGQIKDFVFVIFKTDRATNGIQAKDTASPKWPASKYPESLGENIKSIAVKMLIGIENLKLCLEIQ